MKYPVIKSRPSVYVITIDGKVVEDAGKNGIIKDESSARHIRSLLETRNPESDVLLFGFFELTGAE